MKNKVVYNPSYGGFRLPDACVEYMILQGDQHDPEDYWYWSINMPRHDKNLVAYVEERIKYGWKELEIAEIEGDRYIVYEYDGLETVIEPKDLHWIIVEDGNTGQKQD